VSAEGSHRTEGFPYALDNGAWSAYTHGRPFSETRFAALLTALGDRCDWAVLPDEVAGGARSLDLSLRWMRRVLDAAPMALLAVQDGMSVEDVRPWIGPRVGIFVGGSTPWKLKTMRQWCALAGDADAWSHVARVNSAVRIARCTEAGARSFDGTSASRYAVTLPGLDRARKQLSLLSPVVVSRCQECPAFPLANRDRAPK